MAKHTLKTVRRCGELRMQGKSYRAIQREIGNISRITVRTYSEQYISEMTDMMQKCLMIIRQAAMLQARQAPVQQLLTVQQ